MKKITILTLISFFSLSLFAQTFYIKPFLGYGFNMNGEDITESSYYFYEDYDTINDYYSYEAFKMCNGKGLRYGVAAGIDVSQNIAFEFGVLYTKSQSSEVTYTDDGVYDFSTTYSLNLLHSYYFKSSSWQVSPEISINCNPGLFTPYLKLGAVIGFTKIKDSYEMAVTTYLPGYRPFENINSAMEYDRKSSVGVTSTIGCDIYIADNFYLFTELRYTNIYCTPTNGEIIEYNVNGDDELKSLNNSQRYYEFVESYSEADNSDPDEPTKLIYNRFALNNISIQAGMKININLKKTSKTE